MKPLNILLASLLLGGIPAAQASIAIANGDFTTGAGNNIDDVNGWFDNSNGTFWQGAWQTNNAAISPNGTPVVVLGSYESGAVRNTPSADPLVGNYVYQSVGTAGSGETEMNVNFDFGAPNDDPGGRTLGITVAVYAYDGLGGFTPDNNSTLVGASGVTLLDSQSFTLASTGVDGLISTYQAVLDISAAGSRELFLSFNSYRPANTESWPVLDKVVVIADVPTFSLHPGDQSGFVGGVVTLNSAANSEPAPTYQWEYSVDGMDPWSEIPDEEGASLVLDPVSFAHAGYYRVVATNSNSSTASNVALVSVSYPAPVITQQPVPVIALAGSDIELAVTATGMGNLTYQWYKVDAGGDIELAGKTSASLPLPGIAAGDQGGYYVIIFDDASLAEQGFLTQSTSATATVTIADLLITASPTAPATDSFDRFYLPGNVDDVDNINGRPGGVPITTSDANDAATYVAFDKTSQGMTFTTGSDPLGYAISAVTVRHVLWNNFLGNGTYYNLQNGDTLEFQFGTVSGGVKTPVFDSNTAAYSGSAIAGGGGANLGTGTYLTFDLSGAGIGTLAPNTTYYFEIASETGDAFLELSGTSANGYAGGTAFRGETNATIDGTYLELEGDRAFHVDLTGLSGPADDYETWIGGYPAVGAKVGFTEDADGDGIENGLENLFGTNPGVASRGIVQVARNGNIITFRHPQNATPADDLTSAYLWSTDLADFHADGTGSGGTTVTFAAGPDTPVAGTTTVTATISGTVPQALFLALKATRTTP